MIYRWIVALYFIGWLIAAGVTTNYGAKFFIYITYWNFILVTIHHLFTAIACTYGQVKAALWNAKYQSNPIVSKDELTISNIRDRSHLIKMCCLCSSCCHREEEKVISWYHIVIWIGHTLSSVISIPIIVFYWILVAGDQITGWAVNMNIHLIVAIPNIIDGLISGIPWRLYHAFVSMLFIVVYLIFSLVYDLLGGTDEEGNPYIYSGIDYSENPITAIGFMVVLLVLVIPFVHFLFWCWYILRIFLLYHKFKKRESVNTQTSGRTRKTSRQPFLAPVTGENDRVTGERFNPSELGMINELADAIEMESAPQSPVSP